MKNDCTQCGPEPLFCYHDFGHLWNNKDGHKYCEIASKSANAKMMILEERKQYEYLKAKFEPGLKPLSKED